MRQSSFRNKNFIRLNFIGLGFIALSSCVINFNKKYQDSAKISANERGAMALYVAILMFPLVMIFGLAYNIGMFSTAMLQHRNNAQFVAEAALLGRDMTGITSNNQYLNSDVSANVSVGLLYGQCLVYERLEPNGSSFIRIAVKTYCGSFNPTRTIVTNAVRASINPSEQDKFNLVVMMGNMFEIKIPPVEVIAFNDQSVANRSEIISTTKNSFSSVKFLPNSVTTLPAADIAIMPKWLFVKNNVVSSTRPAQAPYFCIVNSSCSLEAIRRNLSGCGMPNDCYTQNPQNENSPTPGTENL